jgi:hypothetical protein
MSDFIMTALSLPFLEEMRSRSRLTYSNFNKDQDRTYSKIKIIPTILADWTARGVRLDEEYAQEVWRLHATKEHQEKDREMVRTRKVVCDAYRELFTMTAITHHHNVQVKYRESDDMAGIDLTILFPSGDEVVQFKTVTGDRDWEPVKRARRVQRGEVVNECVTILTAGPNDVLKGPQPYVPKPEWYKSVPDLILAAKELP